MPRPDRLRVAALCGLAAYGLAAVVVLISPLSPGAIVAAVARWVGDLGITGFGQGWVEFVLNIVLFLPLGLLLTLLWRRPVAALVLSVALSVGAELIQLLLPARTPTLRDIVANALGAAVGVLIAWLVIRRSRPGRPPATTHAR